MKNLVNAITCMLIIDAVKEAIISRALVDDKALLLTEEEVYAEQCSGKTYMVTRCK